MVNDDDAKHDSVLFIAKNELGEAEFGRTMDEATTRLSKSYSCNLIRVVQATIRMSAPTVEIAGDIVIPDPGLAISPNGHPGPAGE